MAERQLPKLNVAGSIPVSRSIPSLLSNSIPKHPICKLVHFVSRRAKADCRYTSALTSQQAFVPA